MTSRISVSDWDTKAPLTQLQQRSIHQVEQATQEKPIPPKVRYLPSRERVQILTDPVCTSSSYASTPPVLLDRARQLSCAKGPESTSPRPLPPALRDLILPQGAVEPIFPETGTEDLPLELLVKSSRRREERRALSRLANRLKRPSSFMIGSRALSRAWSGSRRKFIGVI